MSRRRKILLVCLPAAVILAMIVALYARPRMREPEIAPELELVTVLFPVDRTELARPRCQYRYGSKNTIKITSPSATETTQTEFRGRVTVGSDSGGHSDVQAAIDIPTWKPSLKDRILHHQKLVGGQTVIFQGAMGEDGLITWEGQSSVTELRIAWAEDLRLLFLAPLDQLERDGHVTYSLASVFGKNMKGDIEYRVMEGELWKGKEGVRIEITFDGHCDEPVRSISGKGTCHLATDNARMLHAGLELKDSYQMSVTAGEKATVFQMQATRTSWIEQEP